MKIGKKKEENVCVCVFTKQGHARAFNDCANAVEVHVRIVSKSSITRSRSDQKLAQYIRSAWASLSLFNVI